MLNDIDGGFVAVPWLDEESVAILKEARRDIDAYYAKVFAPTEEAK